jgi:hypothetical protein
LYGSTPRLQLAFKNALRHSLLTVATTALRLHQQQKEMPNFAVQVKPVAFIRAASGFSSIDVQMEDPEVEGSQSRKHFTVAIDFGTTFSLVSFIALGSAEPAQHIDPDQIESIDCYPAGPLDSGYAPRKEVPTESWYPKTASRNHSIGDGRLGLEDGLAFEELSGDDETQSQHGGHDQNGNGDMDIDAIQEDSDDESSRDYFWGYEVQKQLQYPDTNRDQRRRVARSKLLLDSSDHTARIREQLSGTLQELKKRRLITQDTDVIADFLERLFRHTKERLTRCYDFQDSCSVEFVLCVPAIWTRKACRKMQTAMEKAIARSGFGNMSGGSIDNLFIVTEPEAAATHVLEGPHHNIMVYAPRQCHHQKLTIIAS